MRSVQPAGKSDLPLDDPHALFTAAFDHVADLIAICDAQGRLVFLNPAARGLALDDATGTELDAAMWGQWYDNEDRPVAPEDWPLRRALMGEVQAEVEGYRLNPDGSRLWMLLSAAPIRDVHGAIIGAVATCKDVSERRRVQAEAQTLTEDLAQRVGARTAAFESAQRALQREVQERLSASELLERSRRMLQAILDRSTAVIYVKDSSYRYLLVNSEFERIFNVRNADVAGHTDYELFSTDIVEPLRANDARVLIEGTALHFEEVVPQDGELHTYVSVKFPLRSDDGTVYAMCGISTDITKLRRAEELVRRHQAELAHVLRLNTMGEMAANLAHEINQPLGAIANYAQGSLRRFESGAMTATDIKTVLAEIARESLRAGRITRRVRELLRKEENPQRVRSDVNQIVAGVLEIVAPAARERGSVIRFHQGTQLPLVEVDRIQIEQVVLNLVVNAIEAVATGTGAREIDVSTAVVDGMVEVSVSDNGIGIDPAKLEQVFEPFFTSKPQGLGMGLAISRSIIDAHDGRLWASADGGTGSTFRFVLPAC